MQNHVHPEIQPTFGVSGYQLAAQGGGVMIGSGGTNTGGPSVGTTGAADRALTTGAAGNDAITVGNAGSGNAHTNMAPFIVFNKIIRT